MAIPFRREIDFVDAQVVTGPHTNFPVLISLTLADLKTTANGGNVQNANGYDIIFTSDQAGNTQLAHEIESYTASTGKIITVGAHPVAIRNDKDLHLLGVAT